MQRLWIGMGALLGCGTVAMAAMAAHGVEPSMRPLLQSGVEMQGWHALALLAVGLWQKQGGRLADAAGAIMLLGTLMFCAAVYNLALRGVSLGFVAPAGGTLTMIGWLLLAASAVRSR